MTELFEEVFCQKYEILRCICEMTPSNITDANSGCISSNSRIFKMICNISLLVLVCKFNHFFRVYVDNTGSFPLL